LKKTRHKLINDFDGVDLLPPDYVTDTELKRVNQDFIINSHGKNLLDLCLSSRLCILNGRFLGDSLGYFTSYEVSVHLYVFIFFIFFVQIGFCFIINRTF
jgi:hypothetical protein